jgi:hypothetical protein
LNGPIWLLGQHRCTGKKEGMGGQGGLFFLFGLNYSQFVFVFDTYTKDTFHTFCVEFGVVVL